MKNLTTSLKRYGGRNRSGSIMVRHRGGGHKRRYRFIDFQNTFINVPGIIYKLEYDPYRNTRISLILYKNGLLGYSLSYEGAQEGDIINQQNGLINGNSVFLKDLLVGSLIYNVELKPGNGGQLARSAGSYCQVISKYLYHKNLILIRLKSKEEYLISKYCKANIGIVLNLGHHKKKLYKAGQSRWLGIRPTVRGVAMNPVDHPHGGGEGKSSGGRPSVSFKGVITKGKPTRKKNKKNKFILKSRKNIFN